MPEKTTVDGVNRLGKGELVARFGFPLVMAAREHTREMIFADAVVQLKDSRSEKIETALSEIARIANFRLQDVVEEPAGAATAGSNGHRPGG